MNHKRENYTYIMETCKDQSVMLGDTKKGDLNCRVKS